MEKIHPAGIVFSVLAIMVVILCGAGMYMQHTERMAKIAIESSTSSEKTEKEEEEEKELVIAVFYTTHIDTLRLKVLQK